MTPENGSKENCIQEGDFLKDPSITQENVQPLTLQFLREAIRLERERGLQPFQRKIVGRYYGTGMRFVDIQDDVSRKMLRTQLFVAMARLWDSMPSEIREKFPKQHIRLLKQNDVSQTEEESAEEELFYGKKVAKKPPAAPRVYQRSEEHRRKIAEALRGKKLTPEHKDNIRKGVERKWDDPDYTEAVRESVKEKPPVSDATKKKISEAKKARNRNEKPKE